MDDLPLNALRAFAAIYESGGVRPAARQLSTSPFAIHRHLRELETRIGTRLIEPGGGAVVFTVTGARLARVAQEALATLGASVEAAREDRRVNDVVIATTESVARRWLLPRLVGFRGRHPRIVVSLRVGTELAHLPRDADLALRTGAGRWRDAIAEPLMDDQIAPVVSSMERDLATIDDRAALIEALLARPLVHDRDAQASWRRWAAAQGVDDMRLRGGARLPSCDLVLDAARLGLGVAMGRLRMAAGAIASGELIALTALSVPIGPSYWLMRQTRVRAAEQHVIDWLRDEARADQLDYLPDKSSL